MRMSVERKGMEWQCEEKEETKSISRMFEMVMEVEIFVAEPAASENRTAGKEFAASTNTVEKPQLYVYTEAPSDLSMARMKCAGT